MKNWEKYQEYLETGDFHVHTDYGDGECSISEMCEQAIQNNLKLICFAEHVRKKIWYDFNAFVDDIDHARQLYPQLKILQGCEARVVDFEGNLDVSDDVLEKAEILVMSFHSFPYADKEDFLRALFGALKHPRVDIWGHPVTFLRNVNLTTEDLHLIINECKKRHVIIEDSLAQAYPTPPNFLNACRELGATVVRNSDAHLKEDLKIVK